MKLTTTNLIWIFLWSLFMGVTAISIGFGALFPSMNLISKPFVCPNGKMEHVDQVYNPYPGTTITTITWYCVDARGGKTELGVFPMNLYSGIIYGLLLFFAILIGMVILTKRSASGPQENENTGDAGIESLNGLEQAERFRKQAEKFREQAQQFQKSAGSPRQQKPSGDAVEKMKELKKLRDADLISEAEYQSKRAEILKEL